MRGTTLGECEMASSVNRRRLSQSKVAPYNNNTLNQTFLANWHQFSNQPTYNFPFIIKTKIDKVELSLKSDQHLVDLENSLVSSGVLLVTNGFLNKSRFRQYKSFFGFNSKVIILFDIPIEKQFRNAPQLRLIIHDPSQSVCDILNDIFLQFNIKNKVSLLELAFDCFTENEPDKLEYFLQWYCVQTRQKKHSFRYENTKYSTQSKCIKFVKIYRKPAMDFSIYKCVRLELTLKRAKIRELGIFFPFLHIDIGNVRNFFSFQEINQRRMERAKRILLDSYRDRMKAFFVTKPTTAKRKAIRSGLLKNMPSMWLYENLLYADTSKTREFLRKNRSAPYESGYYVVPLNSIGQKFIEAYEVQGFVIS
jgi:hypothetical protein